MPTRRAFLIGLVSAGKSFAVLPQSTPIWHSGCSHSVGSARGRRSWHHRIIFVLTEERAMNKLLSLGVIGALVVLTGCENSKPGGPGATSNSSERKLIGQADDTFRLDMPNLSTNIKQGETKIVSVGIKRGKNFGQDVTLKFDNVPKGVTIEPAAAAIKHGEEDAKLTIKVAEDAALGDFTVGVSGVPGTGATATNDLKIKVEKK
jgi:hypothetical protein